MKMRSLFIYFFLLTILITDISTAFAQAKASPSVKSVQADDPEEHNQTFWTHGSLVFDKKSSEWLNAALKSYDQKIPIEILLPSLFPSVTQQDKGEIDKLQEATTSNDVKPAGPIESPTFHLKSILYFSNDNWSLWLNQKMFTATTDRNFENITLLNTSRYSATFLWKGAQIDLIYPNWKNIFLDIENNKYVSPEKNIIIDSLTNTILFILKPNQSLDSKTLQIIEGPANDLALTTKNTPIANAQTKNDKAPTQESVNDTPSFNRPIINTIDSLKNLEILKSLLDDNIEQLR